MVLAPGEAMTRERSRARVSDVPILHSVCQVTKFLKCSNINDLRWWLGVGTLGLICKYAICIFWDMWIMYFAFNPSIRKKLSTVEMDQRYQTPMTIGDKKT